MSGTPYHQGGEPLLVAEQVRKVYRTGEIEVEALTGLDLTVPRGEMVAVVGPSGSGKTTLLNCLSGLDDIDGGRVLVDGEDLFAMSDAKRTAHRATSMGFVFQAFNVIPVFTAAENVELPLLLGGTPAKEARRRAVRMLGRVGLGHRPPRPDPPARPPASTPPWLYGSPTDQPDFRRREAPRRASRRGAWPAPSRIPPAGQQRGRRLQPSAAAAEGPAEVGSNGPSRRRLDLAASACRPADTRPARPKLAQRQWAGQVRRLDREEAMRIQTPPWLIAGPPTAAASSRSVG
jgi:ABC transporter